MDKIPENASRKEIIKAVNNLIEIRNQEVQAEIKELEAEIAFLKNQNELNLFFGSFSEPYK